jgi:hypothetical protein
MKRVISIIVVLAFCLTTAAVFAGGDKNQGDKGKGTVVQNQIRK